MPELPDVENFRRYFDGTALHKRIAGVEVLDDRFLKGRSRKMLSDGLSGRTFTETRRHGKFLLVAIDKGEGWLVSHFGMTGYLRYFKEPDDDPKYDRVRVDFDNGHHLAFVSKRMLGHVRLVADADRFVADEDLGPDALDVAGDRAAFRELLETKGGGIKSALMDQGAIAGIGNVYSDEILYHARVNPAAKVDDLDEAQRDRLFEALGAVLTTAIDRGAGAEDTPDRVPEDWLLPHRQEGAACPRCGGKIVKRKIAGRGAYLCPKCQG